MERDIFFLYRVVGGYQEYIYDRGKCDQHIPDQCLECNQEYRDNGVQRDKNVLHHKIKAISEE